MSHFFFFDAEVAFVVRVGGNTDGDLFFDGYSIAGEPDNLFGVIGQKAHTADAEVNEDLCPDAVFAQVWRKTKLDVGFDSVQTLFLEFIGADFLMQTDAAAFLSHV